MIYREPEEFKNADFHDDQCQSAEKWLHCSTPSWMVPQSKSVEEGKSMSVLSECEPRHQEQLDWDQLNDLLGQQGQGNEINQDRLYKS